MHILHLFAEFYRFIPFKKQNNDKNFRQKIEIFMGYPLCVFSDFGVGTFKSLYLEKYTRYKVDFGIILFAFNSAIDSCKQLISICYASRLILEKLCQGANRGKFPGFFQDFQSRKNPWNNCFSTLIFAYSSFTRRVLSIYAIKKAK